LSVVCIPPGFGASVPLAIVTTASPAPIAVNPRSFPVTPASLANRRRALPPAAAWRSRRLFIQPHVFHAPAVVDAVAHDRQAFDVRVVTIARRSIEDHRTRAIIGQLLLDLPDQFLAFCLIALHRLLVDQLVELGIAIA